MDKTKIDKRVGMMTVSILEQVCMEVIRTSWNNHDLKTYNEYLGKYATIQRYKGKYNGNNGNNN